MSAAPELLALWPGGRFTLTQVKSVGSLRAFDPVGVMVTAQAGEIAQTKSQKRQNVK